MDQLTAKPKKSFFEYFWGSLVAVPLIMAHDALDPASLTQRIRCMYFGIGMVFIS